MTMRMPTTTNQVDATDRPDLGTGLDLDRLAVDLEQAGTFAVADHLEALVDRAHVLGLDPVSLDVLTDTTAPDVVRERAFAVVVAHLRRLARTDHRTVLTAAA